MQFHIYSLDQSKNQWVISVHGAPLLMFDHRADAFDVLQSLGEGQEALTFNKNEHTVGATDERRLPVFVADGWRR